MSSIRRLVGLCSVFLEVTLITIEKRAILCRYQSTENYMRHKVKQVLYSLSLKGCEFNVEYEFWCQQGWISHVNMQNVPLCKDKQWFLWLSLRCVLQHNACQLAVLSTPQSHFNKQRKDLQTPWKFYGHRYILQQIQKTFTRTPCYAAKV